MDAKQKAMEADRAGRCIVCDKLEADRRRGLCVLHYNRFRSALQSVPAKNRDQFQQKLIDEGHLLPSKQGQRVDLHDDVFAQVAEQFLARADAESLLDEDAPRTITPQELRAIGLKIEATMPKEPKVKGSARKAKRNS